MAKTGKTIDEIKRIPNLDLIFQFHWLRKLDRDVIESFERMLGVRWSVADIRSRAKGGTKKFFRNDEEIVVPLALILNPNLFKDLLSVVGDGKIADEQIQLAPGQDMVELSSLSKEDYLKKINDVMGRI